LEPEDEDDDDSTYEVSSEESDDSDSVDMEEEVEFEVAVPIITEPIGDDGQSDYQGSDDGEGPDEAPHRLPIKERLLNRAIGLVQHLGIHHFWIVALSRFSKEQRRWVNKGPVLIYFTENLRLMGTFLYGTKSSIIDMECRLF
jgi:hypothetical protein